MGIHSFTDETRPFKRRTGFRLVFSAVAVLDALNEGWV